MKIRNCTRYKKTNNIKIKFLAGDIAYDKYYAQRGKLVKIYIKKVVIKKNIRTYNQIIPIYYDRDNAVYGESNLLTQSEAVIIATAYLNKQLSDINEYLEEVAECQ